MKYLKLKFLLIFAALAMAIPPAWAKTAGFSLAAGGTVPIAANTSSNDNTVSTGTIPGDQGETWNVTIEGKIVSSSFQGTAGAKYWQMGKSSNSIGMATFSTSGINGTITKIVVNCASAGGSGGSVAVDVNNQKFADTQPMPAWINNNTGGEVTFTGSASGSISIKMIPQSGKACYIQSITVTYVDDSPDITITPPTTLPFNDEGGVYTVNASNLPDNGLGVSVSDGFSRYLINGNNEDPNYWFSAPNNAVTDGQTRVNYTGREFSATGTITYKSGSAIETANLSYRSDVYIVTDNGVTNDWHFERGVKMDYADNTYTGEFTSTNPNTFIVFARKLTESSQDKLWGTRYVFGPTSDDDWVYGDNTSGTLNLNDAKVIKFPEAGTYTITITAQDNKFSISKASELVTYKKVTSTSQLEAGKKYIFVEEGLTNAPSAMGPIKDKFGSVVNVDLNDGSVQVGTDVAALTLGGTTGAWTFKFDDGTYLTAGNSTNLNSGTNASTWVVSNNNGAFNGFRAKHADYSREIRRSNGYERYGNYSTTDVNSEIAFLYVEDDGTTPVVQTVATPVISPGTGTYTEAQTVTITCATEGAAISYKIGDGEYQPYTAAFKVSESCTITAKATKEGWEPSEEVSATYTINLPITVNTLAAAKALDDDAEFNFTGDVVVTFKQTYTATSTGATHTLVGLRDKNANEGGGVFHNAKTAIYDALDKGKVLNPGWTADKETHEGWIQFEDINNVTTAEETVEVLPFDRTNTPLSAANQSEYIILNNVTIDGTTLTVNNGAKGATYALYDLFNLDQVNIADGQYKSLVGVVGVNGETVFVYPLELTPKDDLTLGFNPVSVSLYVGETFEAPALTGVPEGETIPVTYTVTNTDPEVVVATVTDNVVAITGTPGTATVTATFNGDANYNPTFATYTITVNEKLAHGMSFSAETLNVTYGDEEYTAPTLNNPNGLDVTYSSDNEHVAVVDENSGELILGDAGKAVITATTDGDTSHNGGSVSYTINIAKAAAGLSYGEPTPEFTVYVDQDFEAPTLTNPHNLTVTYKSTDDDVALVDETGDVLIGEKVGDATITASVAESTNYLAGSASYIIHVIAKDNVTMSFDPTSVTLYLDQEFTQPTLTTDPANLTVKYSSNNEAVAMVDENSGEVVLMDKVGTATITAKYAGNDQYNPNEASYTIKVENRPEILIETQNLDLGTDSEGEIFVMASDLKENVNVTSSNSNFTVEPATITPEQAANGVNVTVTYTGNNPEGESTTITFSTKDGEDVEVTVTAKAETYVDIAKPTFSPAAGTYTEPKEVAIACATPGVTIMYTMDGVTKTYEGPFLVDHSCTVTATASKGSKVAYNDSEASAGYTINKAAAAAIADDYYYMQNNELSSQYANVAGRRTLNFVGDPDQKAGTVFRVETGNDGAVKTLRSQAVDLQGYANRAMAYVPKVIDLVLSTLANSSLGDPETPGEGILGENGVDLILQKFYDKFDYNLYVEGTEGAYRIYGRTPSMQHVVDFYHENTAQVEEKLPMLETYINQVLEKIKGKIPAPYDANVVIPFSLKAVRDRIAEKNGITLIDPTVDEMGFYRQVLNNKEYVWDFAYQTAMMYVDVIKQTGTYQSLDPEYKRFVDKMQNIRPETKYYMIQYGNEPDYVSENNVKIIGNDPSTFWTLTPRVNFTVNVPEANKLNDSYYTTLYTDFAYELPTGVNAYAVTGIDANKVAELTEITGTIPAQTPVLLKADAAGDKVLTIKKESRGGAIEGNLLEGPDYLINKYQFEAPTVANLFTMAASIVPADILADYEYLKLRNSGTVNNKYFWNVNSDLENITGINVLRSLSTSTGELAFSDDSMTEDNKAFMVSETEPVIYLSIDTVATPTLSLVPGSYTGNQTLEIECDTQGATISYSTDGGNNWTAGTSVTLTEDCTVMVKAEKEGMIPSKVVTAEYIIDMPAEVTTITPFKGYYQIKNNENNKYANVAGRRTLNFLSENDAMSNAGTIFYLETNDSCKVLSLRSQGVDLQGYANRAMHYVPDMVQLVVNTLHAEGAGSDYILGENGLDEIMAKFNECFDYHLYVEPVGDSWRIYGKTPSMQHVVDFYRAHTAQVEAKLPMLEDFINDALTKLRNKIGGETVFTPFSLHQIWENMGGNLPEPVVGDDAAIMDFYRAVLNNKNYVWDFAYQTAQIYWNNVKRHPRYNELKAQLGEYADYIDEFVNQVRPDFKYYIIQRGDEPDYISEGNAEINDARSLWTLEEREYFKLTSAGELFGCPLATTGVGGYFTTNYTDFAYTLPDGVTAYKVTDVDADGEAVLEVLTGTIPAQTPVLLVAKEDGEYEVTLTTDAGTAVSGNLLQGPDYLITLYQFKTPMVVDLFTFAQGILGQTLYDTYVAPYEYLQLRYSGTVNNKYFWNVNSDLGDITGANVLRSLSAETGELAFSDNTKTETNKAFMVSEDLDVITLPGTLRGDVNHDGRVDIKDVTDLIDRLLDNPGPACPYCSNFNEDYTVNIKDATDLIDFLLSKVPDIPVADEGEGE